MTAMKEERERDRERERKREKCRNVGWMEIGSERKRDVENQSGTGKEM
jgi:hypothetical protein